MDFTDFINSRDVRDYHRNLNYKYSASEAAWLTYMCKAITVSEKHKAWEWIINNMPDEAIYLVDENDNTKSVSIHKALEDFIDMEDSFIEYFIDNSDGKIYLCDDSSSVFSNWKNCVSYILENKAKNTWPVSIYFTYSDDSIPYYSNGNIRIQSDGKIGNVNFNIHSDYIYEKTNLELDILNFFQLIEPELPNPFKAGDILCCYEYNGRNIPFVYSFSDKTDEQLLIYGYTIDNKERNGSLNYAYPNSISGVRRTSSYSWDYPTNIEYYREELKGSDRRLISISDWLKGKYDNNIAMFLDDFMTEK